MLEAPGVGMAWPDTVRSGNSPEAVSALGREGAEGTGGSTEIAVGVCWGVEAGVCWVVGVAGPARSCCCCMSWVMEDTIWDTVAWRRGGEAGEMVS